MSSILNTAIMPRLNETNYLTWNVCMCALLIRNNLWGVISGKESPSDPTKASLTKINNFMTCQLKATAEIALYVDDTQIIHIQDDDPKVIWDTLASIHRAHGLSTQLAAMRKFSCIEKCPKQSIMSWVGNVKTQAYLMKDIGIKLPDLLTIVVLTSSLPSKYDSIVVALDAVKPDKLTLDLAISCLLNKEECHLSCKQLDIYKASLIKGEPNNSNAAFTAHSRANITCFEYRKKGHYAKECANLAEETPDTAW